MPIYTNIFSSLSTLLSGPAAGSTWLARPPLPRSEPHRIYVQRGRPVSLRECFTRSRQKRSEGKAEKLVGRVSVGWDECWPCQARARVAGGWPVLRGRAGIWGLLLCVAAEGDGSVSVLLRLATPPPGTRLQPYHTGAARRATSGQPTRTTQRSRKAGEQSRGAARAGIGAAHPSAACNILIELDGGNGGFIPPRCNFLSPPDF